MTVIIDEFGDDVPIMYRSGYNNFTEWCTSSKDANTDMKHFITNYKGRFKDMFLVFYVNNTYNVESIRRQNYIKFSNDDRKHLTHFKNWVIDMAKPIEMNVNCVGVCGRRLYEFEDHAMLNGLLYNTCPHCKNVICNKCISDSRDAYNISKCNYCGQGTYYDDTDVNITSLAEIIANYIMEHKNGFDKKQVIEWRKTFPEYKYNYDVAISNCC
jgi:hypothetical protein